MPDSANESRTPEPCPGPPTLKQIEAQLARMTKVFMDSADPIVIRDMNGNVTDMNLETERVFGWSRKDVLGARTKEFLTPQFRHVGDEVLERVQNGETVRNVEAAVRTKNGCVVPVLATVFLLKDEHDQACAYAEIIKDVTLQKAAAMELSRRNRELQQFANVLAHDLGAPLRSVRRSAQLLEQECAAELSEEGKEHIEYIVSGIDRLDHMVDDLLEYVRVEHQSVTFQRVDCNDALRDAIANLDAAIAENDAKVTSDPLPTIEANRDQLVRLFQNLIGNAIKFRRDEPPVIHVGAKPIDDRWEFTVRDNGIGIDPRHANKIFEVFRRLHGDSVFPGTGIGLSICKAIVTRHGGEIWVDSVKGNGAMFHVVLPERPPVIENTPAC